MDATLTAKQESPDYVQVSTAAAITLGLKPGRFWRGAKLRCVNLLLTYADGCKGACAYCGLNRRRTSERSFIRVAWPVYSASDIISRLRKCEIAERACISMVTHRRALDDLLEVARRITSETGVPVSGLITPTLVSNDDLSAMRRSGVDKIGIAIDAATPQLFRKLRGGPGPHRWERYWERFGEAVEVFGTGNVGSHFIVGLGETERNMAAALQRVHDLGGVNHLFSFYPEAGTEMEDVQPPPMPQYRRVQLAAEIVDSGLASADDFTFDEETGRITSFGIAEDALDGLVEDGRAFMTRGCAGKSGEVACNRPFGNSPPGAGLRNYPFRPDKDDVALIRRQLAGAWTDETETGFRRHKRRRDIIFSAPAIKHFDTDEFKNSGRPVFAPVSITGEECRLGCSHCRGRLLAGMYEASTPDRLWSLAKRLRENGCRGLLLTGGCDEEGVVPLTPFCDTLARIKDELGMKAAVHVRLLDEVQAAAVARSRADVAMIDVIGSDEVLHTVYNLPTKSLSDVTRSVELLHKHGVPLAPHIVIGHTGGLADARAALGMLDGRGFKSIVFVFVMPLSKKDETAPIDVNDVRRFFRSVRRRFPDTPLLLGCARPMGDLQRKIDRAALDAHFDGIAYPADGTVARARKMGLKPKFSEFCCSLLE